MSGGVTHGNTQPSDTGMPGPIKIGTFIKFLLMPIQSKKV